MKKVALIILDGFGVNEKEKIEMPKNFIAGSLITKVKSDINKVNSLESERNSFSYDAVNAKAGYRFKKMFSKNPHTLLFASGEAVGLPNGQMGNSEVGHLNIGASEIVQGDLRKIDLLLDSGNDFVKLEDMLNVAKDKIHLIGLVSNGNVHSSIGHLFKIIDRCIEKKIKNVHIHFISDGRDTFVNEGINFANQIIEKCKDAKSKGVNVDIASIGGRYYAMDREKNFYRTEMYYNAITKAKIKAGDTVVDYIAECYSNGVTDEFIKPRLFNDEAIINKDDVVFFFNFRADRMRQIVGKFIENDYNKLYSMISYDDKFQSVNGLICKEIVKNTLSEKVCELGLKQLKVAELSKYAHITYFLNGGLETPYKNETRILAGMVDVPTFDLAPKMSAEKVCENTIDGMKKGYDLIVTNFANCDMVGHTGNFKATKMAVAYVAKCALKIAKKAKKLGYTVVITADHGNAERMRTADKINTAHTTNRVPFVIVNGGDINLKNGGCLSNITPTILELLQGD